MAKTIKTNEQLVRDLMNYSPFGALSQAFVMTAIQHYAEAVAKEDPKKFDSDFMHGESWVGVAKDIKTRCDAFYNRHN